MRAFGLLVLSALLPAFAHAANPPTLTVYTVSHDTLYPAATAESGLATTTTIDIAFSEQVKASIKIVSAGGATVRSLYSSSSVTNPTPKMWDGTNDASAQVDDGTYTVLISATSTATGLSMTDSSKTITVASSGASDSSTSSTTSSADASTYTPPPSTITVDAGADRNAVLEVPLHLFARVASKSGTIDSSARVSWSFGDGSSAEGGMVDKTYRYAGTYLVVVNAADGSAFARDELLVTARPARVRVSAVSGDGITIANDGSERLDLSRWLLSSGASSFRIPNDTVILPEANVLFPSAITNLPIALDAALFYPNNRIAASYVPSVSSVETAQLSAPRTSSDTVQTVEPATEHTNISGAAHAVTAVAAPRVAAELAALGAALPPVPATSTETNPVASASSIFHSPWTLGFLGVMAFAGGAFIFL